MVRFAIAAASALSLATLLAGAPASVAEDAPVKTPPVVKEPEQPLPAEPAEKPAEQPADPGAKADDPPPAEPDAGAADEGDTPPDEMSLGEVPVIEIVELTPESARKSVDAFVLVRDKYKDAAFEEFESLQAFVEKAPDGRAFETDMKTFGFATVDEWYKAVTTVGLAYSAITDDQFADIKQQIEEVRQDPELAQDMKERLIKGLEATIPTENNRKVVEALIADTAYTEKLKLLDAEEE
jgi:hypothetical protein